MFQNAFCILLFLCFLYVLFSKSHLILRKSNLIFISKHIFWKNPTKTKKTKIGFEKTQKTHFKKPGFFQVGFFKLPTLTGMSKKRRTQPKLSYEKSQHFGPINLKMCMNNLNTHGFQHIKYKILNLKAFWNIHICFWFSKMKNEQK